MAFAFAATIVMYLLTMFYLPNYINVSYIFDLDFFGKILSITVISWLPFVLASKLVDNKKELNN